MDFGIRPASRADLPALTEIYNHYIRSSYATFDLEEFTVEARTAWFDEHGSSGRHLLVVAEAEDVVVGYATSSQFRTKAAYDGSVETTVYVSPSALGHGIGRALYAVMLDQLDRAPDLHRAYAGIAMPNDASVELHLRSGFRSIGTFTEAGFKFGEYVDVQWFERSLST